MRQNEEFLSATTENHTDEAGGYLSRNFIDLLFIIIIITYHYKETTYGEDFIMQKHTNMTWLGRHCYGHSTEQHCTARPLTRTAYTSHKTAMG